MPSPDWPAPLVGERIDADVTLPGSKSLTNRFLVLAALANGTSRLRRPLRSRDTLLMAEALRSLGAGVEDGTADTTGGADWVITPASLRGGGTVDCGLAGTVMRFLPPVAALCSGPVAFDGDAQARVRPMGPVLEALRALGASIDDGGRGTSPSPSTAQAVCRAAPSRSTRPPLRSSSPRCSSRVPATTRASRCATSGRPCRPSRTSR